MSVRMRQINAVIGAEVSQLLERQAGQGAIVTVTAVETARDLSQATVWLSLIPADPERWEQVIELRPEVQAGLARRLTMKRTPKLVFREDRSGEKLSNLDRLLADER